MNEASELKRKLEADYARYPGQMSKQDYIDIRTECGCTTCDCDALSQNSYRQGCHFYNLFDQPGDATNMCDSAGMYDESVGYVNSMGFEDEDFDYFQISPNHEDSKEDELLRE